MADLFLFVTKEGFSAIVQLLSLGYNLSGILSMVFEMIESRKWAGNTLRVVKRLMFNHEIAMIGELLCVTVLQMFITSLNRSALRDSVPVALAISYYAWGLMGHGIFAIGLALFLFATRAIGAVSSIWWRYRSLAPLFAPCCVDSALGIRQKLAITTGYCWNNGKLFYSKQSLSAYGLMHSAEETKSEAMLVQEKVHWFVTPVDGLVAIGIIKGTHVEPREERPHTGLVTSCSRMLVGQVHGTDDQIVELLDGDAYSDEDGCQCVLDTFGCTQTSLDATSEHETIKI